MNWPLFGGQDTKKKSPQSQGKNKENQVAKDAALEELKPQTVLELLAP